jgi:uncharacterized membrane protein HdeD (DUF308 family)
MLAGRAGAGRLGEVQMSETIIERRRTGWDVAIGALLAIGGVVLLAHAAFATAVSVLFVGWMLLAGGIVALVASLFRIGKGDFWSMALSGGLLAVLGLVILRNLEATAVTLTLIAGALFLVSGIVRLVVGVETPEYRVPLIFAGVVSTALGLIVLFNLIEASFVLLGVLLGVQALIDGITMMLIGRWHVGSLHMPGRAAHA